RSYRVSCVRFVHVRTSHVLICARSSSALDGLVTVTVAGRSAARANQISHCCDGTLPPRRRFGSKGPQRWSGDEMALKVERVMDGSMHIEKTLGRGSRFEPLHFALSSSHDLVGVLGAVVRP